MLHNLAPSRRATTRQGMLSSARVSAARTALGRAPLSSARPPLQWQLETRPMLRPSPCAETSTQFRLRHAGVEMENGRDVASWALEAACWISPWSRVQWKVPDQAVCAAGTLGVSPRRTTAAAEAVWSAPSAPKACKRRRDGAVLASHVEVHRTRSSLGRGSHGVTRGGVTE